MNRWTTAQEAELILYLRIAECLYQIKQCSSLSELDGARPVVNQLGKDAERILLRAIDHQAERLTQVFRQKPQLSLRAS